MSAGSVELCGVTQRFGTATTALREIELCTEPGITALIGVNGAGKSTLMSVAAGCLRPTSGRVRVDGLDPYGPGRRKALRQVALMPQSMALPRNMTAREVVSYLTWMRGHDGKAAHTRAVAALEQVQLSSRLDEKIGKLSGGMVRRVALAQALASGAPVLLLDEPSTGLDPEQRRIMVDLLKGLQGTILMSSHVMEDVVDVAANVVILDEGQVIFHGPVAKLAAHAPADVEPGRAAEAAFLHLITSRTR